MLSFSRIRKKTSQLKRNNTQQYGIKSLTVGEDRNLPRQAQKWIVFSLKNNNDLFNQKYLRYMFEKLLMNVVQDYLKDYFEDFDSSNLQVGVWSGDVQLNNMQLKKSIFQVLDLPLEVLFSSIGSVRLRVPWKNLLSQPIEAEISNVFILIGATSPEKWQIKDFNEIKRKLLTVETLREQFTKKVLEKQSTKPEEDAGVMQRMVLKIIDNIQVKIEDIHIRFEDIISNTYSWGIALNKLETYTCDDLWKRKYIDRTLPENVFIHSFNSFNRKINHFRSNSYSPTSEPTGYRTNRPSSTERRRPPRSWMQ